MVQGLLSDGAHEGLGGLRLSCGACGFFRRPSPWSWLLPPSPNPRVCFLSMSPQMMIMLGAICAIIVVVIVSKYR